MQKLAVDSLTCRGGPASANASRQFGRHYWPCPGPVCVGLWTGCGDGSIAPTRDQDPGLSLARASRKSQLQAASRKYPVPCKLAARDRAREARTLEATFSVKCDPNHRLRLAGRRAAGLWRVSTGGAQRVQWSTFSGQSSALSPGYGFFLRCYYH